MTITMTHPEARAVFLTTHSDSLIQALVNVKTKVPGSAPKTVSALVSKVERTEVFPDHTGDPRRITLTLQVQV